MNKLGIINRETTAFVLVDIQDKFIPVIHNIEEVISNANILTKSAEILKIPLIVTEQYPKGLGHTSKKIYIPNKSRIFEKMSFSCFGNEKFVEEIKKLCIKSIVLFGIEAHVCVLKTALDALKNNYEVHVVGDAISSRKYENKVLAIERMRQSGAFIASTEMILFQLMDVAGTEEFKLISKLIK